MRGQSISNWNVRSAVRAETELGMASRKPNQGNSAWSLPSGKTLKQPQDGAPTGISAAARALLTSLRQANPLAEPEDATLTGGTRSLTRRLLGLNVTSAQRKTPLAALKPLAKRQTA
jgi:hypothetical protein